MDTTVGRAKGRDGFGLPLTVDIQIIRDDRSMRTLTLNSCIKQAHMILKYMPSTKIVVQAHLSRVLVIAVRKPQCGTNERLVARVYLALMSKSPLSCFHICLDW